MALSESWDASSLGKIARLIGFASYLAPHVQAALQEGADAIISASQENMPWGPGPLYDSMQRMTESPFEVIIGSDLSYSRRREYGFSGQTDALGRFYANDPGAFFLSDALASEQDTVLALLQDAIEATLAEGG